MLYRVNLVLGFALASVFALLLMLRVDNSRPNYQVNLGDDMTYSPAYTAFEPNSNFANGRTLQDPVPGTIARGTQIFPFEATPEDALRAGEQLVNPYDSSTEEGIASAERGAVVFQAFCTSCHGADGTGNGPVAQRGFPPPPSLLIGKSREMKDGQLFHILTCGQNSMPNFAAQLPPHRRWDVINHIRSLQKEAESSLTTPAETPPLEASAPAAEQASAPLPESSQIIQPDSVAPAQADTEK